MQVSLCHIAENFSPYAFKALSGNSCVCLLRGASGNNIVALANVKLEYVFAACHATCSCVLFQSTRVSLHRDADTHAQHSSFTNARAAGQVRRRAREREERVSKFLARFFPSEFTPAFLDAKTETLHSRSLCR